MENEIKVNEYIRTKRGIIDRVVKISDNYIFLKSKFFITEYGESSTFIKKTDVVKHSPNLIDLIQCGDYVNGYKVVETYKDKQLSGWQVGDLKEDETWLGVVVSSKMIKEPLQEYFDNEMIKTIVTKEQIESISYKLTKM